MVRDEIVVRIYEGEYRFLDDEPERGWRYGRVQVYPDDLTEEELDLIYNSPFDEYMFCDATETELSESKDFNNTLQGGEWEFKVGDHVRSYTHTPDKGWVGTNLRTIILEQRGKVFSEFVIPVGYTIDELHNAIHEREHLSPEGLPFDVLTFDDHFIWFGL